jgi:2-dehydro-3-deoxygalactonokinase
MAKYLLGCDWGTSSFRLCLFDISEQKVVGEIFSEEGIGKMHSAWQKNSNEGNAVEKVPFFCNYLSKQIEALSNQHSVDLSNVTVIISGMASSSIGMLDVPYAKLPFAIDGSDAVVKRLQSIDDFQHTIILVPGVCSDNDVMRGEETQLIGLWSLLKQSGTKIENGVMIFPGTHSKHIYVEDRRLINFKTYMTGEVFNIISNHSILKDSVQKNIEKGLSPEDNDAFKLGVQQSKKSGILNGLFTVRTNQLFNKLTKKSNFFYLSGLLIGEELNYLLKNEEQNLFLCSGSNLNNFYKMAVEELNLSGRTTIVATDLVDKSAIAGQNLIFQKTYLNTEVK